MLAVTCRLRFQLICRLREGARCGDLLHSSRSLPACGSLKQYSLRTKYSLSYAHGHSHDASGPVLEGKTFSNVVDDITEKYPNRDFVVFPEDGRRRTYHQFRDEMDRLAAGLISIGIERGDRVGIWGPNALEWVLTMMATSRIGAVLVNLNPAYQIPEIEYAINKVGLKAIVASQPFKTQRYYEMLTVLCPELETASPGRLRSKRLPSLESVVIMGDKQHPGSFAFDDLLGMGRSEHYDAIDLRKQMTQFDDIVSIQFTSGTTGYPKASCLTHFNILNIMNMTGNIMFPEPSKTLCLPLPLYHAGGTGMVICGMLKGVKTVFPSAGFDSTACLRAIQDEQVTQLVAVPTMLIDILNNPDFDKFDTSSVTRVLTGASPVPVDVAKLSESKFNALLNIVYGMTETSLTVTMTRDTDPEEIRLTSVGRAAPWVEVKITDPSTNEILPVKSMGELCTRSPGVMTGYWEEVEKTKETIDPARWLHTGDLASMDEDGFIHIIGRSKDVVIRGGANIYPVQIEQLLHTHPKIKDVQVVGVPDERLIEELCACIQLKDGETVSTAEIRNFCKGKISHSTIPRYVEFVDAFPLTITGKVQKFKLREEMTSRLNLD